MNALTEAERSDLLARAWAIHGQRFPKDGRPPHDRVTDRGLRESYFLALAEYADRLPRVVMSACPVTGELFRRSFDPWGLDGPWWQEAREVEIEEPRAPPTFKVLLGALALEGRVPVEARDTVLPGPAVPFVVPRLLELPEMVAVVSRLELATGDLAYPICYYSPPELDPEDLHQFWLQQEFWFTREDGSTGWLIANDVWDFDLAPWVASGKLRWIRPEDPEAKVVDASSGERCPYLDLPGDRLPQVLAWGERSLLELPDGTPIDPYED